MIEIREFRALGGYRVATVVCVYTKLVPTVVRLVLIHFCSFQVGIVRSEFVDVGQIIPFAVCFFYVDAGLLQLLFLLLPFALDFNGVMSAARAHGYKRDRGDCPSFQRYSYE
jgi:hypothetical protein